MKAALLDYVRSRTPAIFVQSPEANRVCADVLEDIKKLKAGKPAIAHISIDGVGKYIYKPIQKNTKKADPNDNPVRKINYIPQDEIEELSDPVDLITKILKAENTIFVLEDFHLHFDDVNPFIVGLMKRMIKAFKSQGSIMVVVGCRSNIPPELEKEFIYLEYDLPDKDRLKYLVRKISTQGKMDLPQEKVNNISGSLSGLTMQEAENILYLSMTKNKDMDVDFIANEKATILKKAGTLELIQAKNSIEDIGGLATLKNWLIHRKDSFGEAARQFGLPTPKGILMLGLPGTGKSLTAKATATILGRPLLRLDAGSIFGSLVGESEGNLREALKIAESISPCVLWIDEIEKAFSGTKSSGSSDGGTTQRVFGTMLTWMQDKKSPVFVVGTANSVAELPEEFLRKGRLDEIWFCDLPDDDEREEIWKIQIKKYQRDPSMFDVSTLSMITEGYTGAEIENCFVDAMYPPFYEDREINISDITKAVQACVPLSKMMKENIGRTREWAKERTRMAS